ncbi:MULTISPECIES: hypothetical protein [unclassified Novosphingobium]|uniref:hypothetical protein n=1 Tax=unclassified Novosphingobium TaxID=2644732 RepID=UPI00020EE854|nr:MULTISPECIES: hypothetical protein [unclassified Novosphingobium]GFM28285.1 putative uncharacterized protein [Novosphingobium sp. PY1]CCA91447.1 conserved hypothetical protein [Novosphingobium sp. PP1Y]
MIRATARLFLSAALPAVLAACSATSGYPSLAQREVERIGGSATPVAGEQTPEEPALPPASADLVTRLDGLVAAAQQTDAQFREQQGPAERAVAGAAGAAVTSDSWATAQIALAALESRRGATVAPLAELDTLYAEARDAAPLELSPSAQAIEKARAQVSDIVARQDGVIESLAARLRS